MTTKRRGWATVGLCGALVASGYAQDALAQGALIIGGGQAMNGSANMGPGSPGATYTVTAGGNYDASTAGLTDRFDRRPCVGHTTTAPTFILRISQPFRRFVVRATSGGDVALIINTASGRWRCNDDTEGTNPVIEMQNTTPGQYDIWVTNYQGGAIPANLTFLPN